jgi:hypothetical protein
MEIVKELSSEDASLPRQSLPTRWKHDLGHHGNVQLKLATCLDAVQGVRGSRVAGNVEPPPAYNRAGEVTGQPAATPGVTIPPALSHNAGLEVVRREL